ncbi:MAG: hypothetical protein AAFX99_17435, partial [Myxococcota bacterium]
VEGIAKANPEPDHVDTVEGLFTGQVVSDSRCDDRVDMEVQMLVSTSAPDPGVRLEFMSPSGEALPFAQVTYTGSTLPGSQCVQMFGDGGDELIVCLLAGTPMTFNGVYGHPELACELQLQGGRRY